MSHLAKDMTPDVTWKDITPGCNIYEGGTSSVVETGDWRTMKPVIDWDKCRQCLLCAPVCPDMSIPVNGEGKREDFDYFFCKGCGICANTCPFGAITRSRTRNKEGKEQWESEKDFPAMRQWPMP